MSNVLEDLAIEDSSVDDEASDDVSLQEAEEEEMFPVFTGAEVDFEDFTEVEGFESILYNKSVDLSIPEDGLVKIIPVLSDEFTCSSCFMVFHRSQLTNPSSASPVCSECA